MLISSYAGDVVCVCACVLCERFLNVPGVFLSSAARHISIKKLEICSYRVGNTRRPYSSTPTSIDGKDLPACEAVLGVSPIRRRHRAPQSNLK